MRFYSCVYFTAIESIPCKFKFLKFYEKTKDFLFSAQGSICDCGPDPMNLISQFDYNLSKLFCSIE